MFPIPGRESDAGPMWDEGEKIKLEDCLNEAGEAVNLAGQFESRGDMKGMRLWIEAAQNWLSEAERRVK